jgi:hypothetical protein
MFYALRGAMSTYESINQPQHYTSKNGGLKAIDIIEAWKLNFSRGNAVKYILRAGEKPHADEIQDLEKAVWYLNREIARLKSLTTDNN